MSAELRPEDDEEEEESDMRMSSGEVGDMVNNGRGWGCELRQEVIEVDNCLINQLCSVELGR